MPFLVKVGRETIARCSHASDAAAIVGARGHGDVVWRVGYRSVVVWSEGSEDFPASESFDAVAGVIHTRALEAIRERRSG